MEFNIVEVSLLGGLVFCLLVQLYFSLFVHLKLANAKINQVVDTQKKAISVIICARNEAANLMKNLPFVFNQKNIKFEKMRGSASYNIVAIATFDFKRITNPLRV